MSDSLIPSFDWHQVIVQPWTENFSTTIWIVIMGFLVTASCALVGNYLLLRRMALIGDAISHSILPGLIVAFLIFREADVWVALIGALSAGLATVVIIDFIHEHSRIKPDAAICITFTTLFSIGVVLMSILESKGNFHIDADCVLYGEIAFVSLEPPWEWLGWSVGPPSVWRMGGLLVALIVGIVLFYKELFVTSFDGGLAKSLGMRTGLWHFAIMAALCVVVVAAFESVGVILVIAMLVVPPMFAAQISDSLPTRLIWSVVLSAMSSLAGIHLSLWLNCSAAGAMVVCAAGFFAIVWAARPIVQRYRRRVRRTALQTIQP